MRGLLTLLAFLCVTAVDSAGQIVVHDRFGRQLDARALRLVDWEGYIANPAVEFSIDIPEAWRPATVEIAGSNQRLHFAERSLSRSEPATVDESGPKLTLKLEPGVVPDPVVISIWPDRDGQDEAHSLWIGVHTADGALKTLVLPIIVDDHDQDRPLEFLVTLDTDHDATRFYTNPTVLAETQRAADDWAYFLSDNDFDEVRRGASRSWIWNSDGFNSGYWVTNSQAYRGFMLYAWGMRNVGLYSGGAASGQYQTHNGWPVDLMAGGHIAMEIRGNRNVLGWAFYDSENDWWRNDNHPRGAADFYSHVHHQIGHAMFFSSGHSKWDHMKSTGGSTGMKLISYLGGAVQIDRYDHLFDEGNSKFIVDPASRRGAFGSEYASGPGLMEPRRWIITKTDLLMAAEVGYELRDTTPFQAIALADEVSLAPRGPNYAATMVSGGVPDYFVEVIDGALPAGLRLNSFTGEISGFPTSGDAVVRIRATDQLGAQAESDVLIRTASVLATDPAPLPSDPALLSNHPNPFSGSTVLQFQMDEPGSIRLSVHDLQGREIALLRSGHLSAGSHELRWDAGSLPAGVYLARLQAPGAVQTAPLTVVR